MSQGAGDDVPDTQGGTNRDLLFKICVLCVKAQLVTGDISKGFAGIQPYILFFKRLTAVAFAKLHAQSGRMLRTG